MRLILSVLVAVIGSAAWAAEPPPCIVNITRYNAGGSGTVVGCENGKSLVLTNRHVCEGADGVTVRHGGKTYPASCVAYYAGGDLVLFSVEAELPVAELADDEPPAGATVEQWGFTWHGQGRPVYRAARWSGRYGGIDPRFNARIVETGIVSESGDSGSAVFYKGRVVAVTWGNTAAVMLADVRHFLRNAVAKLFPRLAARFAARRTAMEPPAKKGEKITPPAKKAESKPTPPQSHWQAPPVYYYTFPQYGPACIGST